MNIGITKIVPEGHPWKIYTHENNLLYGSTRAMKAHAHTQTVLCGHDYHKVTGGL